MYKCTYCPTVVGPRQPMAKHTVYGPNGSIRRELPVCQVCALKLKVGEPIEKPMSFTTSPFIPTVIEPHPLD